MNENNDVVRKKPHIGLIILIIFLLIIIIGLITYIAYDKLNESKVNRLTKSNVIKNTDEDKDSKNDKEKIEPRNLTEDELNFFKEHFNKTGINGFITQEFDNSKDINLYLLLYNGIGKQETISEDEKRDFLKQSNLEQLYTDLLKIKNKDIKEFLKINANLDHIDGTAIKNFTYISKYDAYYNEHGDTSYMEIDLCNSGNIDEDGNYIVNCKFKYDNMQIKTTLERKDNNYIFISNKCIGNCEYLPGNVGI